MLVYEKNLTKQKKSWFFEVNIFNLLERGYILLTGKILSK